MTREEAERLVEWWTDQEREFEDSTGAVVIWDVCMSRFGSGTSAGKALRDHLVDKLVKDWPPAQN